MVKNWVAAGQPYEMFWKLTLREITIILEGHSNARKAELKLWSWAVWQNNAYQRTKRLPRKPPELKTKKTPTKPQSIQDMKNIARMWTVAMGGEVKKRQ